MYRLIARAGSFLLFIFFLACKPEESSLPKNWSCEINAGNCFKAGSDYKPLLSYFTSTNCPICGKKGNDYFEDLIQNHSFITPLAIHFGHGDPLESEDALSLFSYFKPSYSPTLFLNSSKLMVDNDSGDIYWDSTKAKTKGLISKLSKETVNFKMGFEAIQNPENIAMRTYILDSPDESTEYYVSYLLLENSVNASQKASLKSTHDHVFRRFITSENRLLKKNSESVYLDEFEFTLSDSELKASSLSLLAILWQKSETSGEAFIANTRNISFKP